jgi:DNA-binding protein HU-beta
MNKTELVSNVAERAGLSRADAEKAVSACIYSIAEALKGGDKVSLIGFGVFSVSERAARAGKNPATGEAIQISAARVPKFKAGKALKDAIQ